MSIQEDYATQIKGAFGRTTYAKWLKSEGVKVYEGLAVEDVRTLELAPWPRVGGNAVFITLYPMMEGAKGMYVVEIPPGKALEPERHLYEKIIMILDGRGTTEVWNEGDTEKHVFEWGRGSIFSPPLNAWHRMFNLGTEPVKFLAMTEAPSIFNGFRNSDFIFNCPYAFRDRFDGAEGYFKMNDKAYQEFAGKRARNIWETNFIHDAFEANLDPSEMKAHGNRSRQFEMSGNGLIGHIAEWPVGRYHKAHYHFAGAVLLGLKSEGYVILWSKMLGNQPYQAGHGDEVVEVPWKEGSLYTPPSDWFHQHFNTGKQPARLLAVRNGSTFAGPGFGPLTQRDMLDRGTPTLISVDEGGSLLEYENEDPEIRSRYKDALRRNGVGFEMPDEIYDQGAASGWHDPRAPEA